MVSKNRQRNSMANELKRLPDSDAAKEGVSVEEFRKDMLVMVEDFKEFKSYMPKKICGGRHGVGYSSENAPKVMKHVLRYGKANTEKEEMEHVLRYGKRNTEKEKKKKLKEELKLETGLNIRDQDPITLKKKIKKVKGKLPTQVSTRKTKILVACCGTQDAVHFERIYLGLSQHYDVKGMATPSSWNLIHSCSVSVSNHLEIYTEECEWPWLSRWANMMIIAPLSATTLEKICAKLSDNLVTRVVRGWNYHRKPLFMAPSMDTSPITSDQLQTMKRLGVHIILGKEGEGSMASTCQILKSVRGHLEEMELASRLANLEF